MATTYLSQFAAPAEAGAAETEAAEAAPGWYTGETVLDFLHQARAQGPLLTSEEEQALAQRVALHDPRAINELVRRNLLLVFNEARRYGTSHPDWWPDLLQAGNMGLWRAVTDYDGRGRFSTYAVWWIRQGINREAHRLLRNIHVPEFAIQADMKIRRARRELQMEGISTPAPALVIERAGVTPLEYEAAEAIPAQEVSLSQLIGDAHGAEADADARALGDTLADAWEGSTEAEDALLDAIDAESAWVEIAEVLTTREVLVLRTYYAEENLTRQQRGQSQSAAAEALGLSRSSVDRIRHEAEAAIRLHFVLTPDGRLLRVTPRRPYQATFGEGW